MKTKRFLSLVIASAMAMQCSVFSVLADNTNSVTVVANDIDTDWKMSFNGWERLEPAFDYYSDWSLTDGFTHTHYGDKHAEVKSVAYYLTQDSNKAFTVYNEKEPSSDYQAWFNRDADGKPIAYDPESTTAQLWYRKSRPNIMANFNVGETVNNGQPIVISFDYQSTNPATGAWVHGPGTAFKIMYAKDKVAYSLYNNAGNNGFTIEHGVENGSTTKSYITSGWDATAEHSVRVVLSPELSAEGRYQMTAIELDGVVTKLEGVVGQAKGLSDVLIHSLEYSAGANGENKGYKDTIKNLKVVRGIAPIIISASVTDGAEDVIPQDLSVNFSDIVELSDGAVKVYENGTELSSSAYTFTLDENSKSAKLSIPDYKGLAAYKLVVDKDLVKGSIGGVMEEDFEINFVTAKKVTMVANDIEKDWKMTWNWERYEDGYSYMSDYSFNDGLKIVNNGSKFTEIDKVKVLSSVTAVNGVPTATYDTNGNTYSFATDVNGNIVAYNADDTTQTLHPWKHKDRNTYEANFNVGETANNGQPITVEFDYKAINPGHETYMAALVSFLGFSVYPNFQGAKVSSATGVGLNNNPDQTNYRQDVVAKIPVGENTEANGWHSVKCIISPVLADNGKCEMVAIEVDGVMTQLEGIYGSATSIDKIYIDTITARLQTDKNDRSLELKNLKVYRSDESVKITSSVANGAINVVPTDIEVNFSSPVTLSEGAVRVYKNGVELSADKYTVSLSEDSLIAYVTIPEYSSRAAYKLVVDNTLVNGIYGGTAENGLEINFVSAKNNDELEGSDENLAYGYTISAGSSNAQGHLFTQIETDKDGVTTITVDNDTWMKAVAANSDKSGQNDMWEYDVDGDGTLEKIGYKSWDFSEVLFNNISDVKNSTEPIVISMDYAFENAGSNSNDIWVSMGDKKTNMFMLTPFGQNPNVSGKEWGGEVYKTGVTEKEWHSVQYVIDPTLDEENRSSISQITLDGEVIPDTGNKWISYSASPAENEANGQYINNLSMRVKYVMGATDENGEYLPTVLKLKNLQILRAKPLQAEIDTDALTSDGNTLTVKFSDPITEGQLNNLKIMKGADVVENAITSASLSNDGKKATLTVNLDATARYNLIVADVTDIYGVESETSAIEFEYYNTTDGYVTVVDAAAKEAGVNTTVSFTFTGSKAVSPLVIAAAYDKDMNLIGVNTKPIDLTPYVYVSDEITLENVTGAKKIQLMAWDDLDSMKPYCLAKDVK